MIDYGILGSDPYKKPLINRPTTANLPSPDSWAGFNANTPPQPVPDNPNIFDGFTPTMRLNEAEYLLNCTPGANGLL